MFKNFLLISSCLVFSSFSHANDIQKSKAEYKIQLGREISKEKNPRTRFKKTLDFAKKEASHIDNGSATYNIDSLRRRAALVELVEEEYQTHKDVLSPSGFLGGALDFGGYTETFVSNEINHIATNTVTKGAKELKQISFIPTKKALDKIAETFLNNSTTSTPDQFINDVKALPTNIQTYVLSKLRYKTGDNFENLSHFLNQNLQPGLTNYDSTERHHEAALKKIDALNKEEMVIIDQTYERPQEKPTTQSATPSLTKKTKQIVESTLNQKYGNRLGHTMASCIKMDMTPSLKNLKNFRKISALLG